MNPQRAGLLVRIVRRLKADDAFDIDPAIGARDLAGFMGRRAAMAVRGVWLALRTGRFAFPVFVGRRVTVHQARHLCLSPGVTIEDDCRLDCLGSTGVHLGRGVTLRRGVQIEVTSVLRDLGDGCVLGDRVGVSEGCFLGAKGLLRIGDDTIIGPSTVIVAENHIWDSSERPIREQGVTRRGIDIGRDCWIGAHVTVLDGVTLGDGCVVGAGAVVNSDLAPSSVGVGVPVRTVRQRGAYEDGRP